jgi:hypothetical protein
MPRVYIQFTKGVYILQINSKFLSGTTRWSSPTSTDFEVGSGKLEIVKREKSGVNP